MNRRTQQCIAAFAITGILFLGLCGFAAVDASTARYMPAESGSLFLITETSKDGMQFSLLGEDYNLPAAPLETLASTAWQYRGMLPHSVTMTARLFAKAYLALDAKTEMH